MSCGWPRKRVWWVLALGLWLAAAATGTRAGAQAAARAEALGQAILERGPLATRGLPFFPPNVLQAYLGEYLAEAQARKGGDARVVVYFTREPLVLPADWRAVTCGQEALLRIPDEERLSFCHVEPGEAGFALFLSFPGESFPWCPWTQTFLQRLRYLLALAQGSPEVPFPAVFEYRKS